METEKSSDKNSDFIVPATGSYTGMVNELTNEDRSGRNLVLLIVVALAALLAKMIFSYHVFETNDMMGWMACSFTRSTHTGAVGSQ